MITTILGKKINYEFFHKELLQLDKPLIVFLHEGLGSIGQWKGFPEKLAKASSLPALVYDRVGYGQSDYWDSELDPYFLQKEAVEYLPKLLENLNISNSYYIFGHSDGGTIALLHAATKPKNLLGAIVEAPHVILEEQSLQGIRMARSLLDQKDMISRMNRYQGGRASQLIDAWTSLWLREEIRDWQMLDLLKKVECPLLLIQGDQDDFGTIKQLELVQEYSSSKSIILEELSPCGHIPHLQQQEIVLKLCHRFIDKL